MSNAIKIHLQKIIDNEPNSIGSFVATEILKQDNPKQYLEDLYHNGCSSGMVTSLIYYKDTYAFFDTYYEDILDLRAQLQEDGECLDENGFHNIKNDWAWTAFEFIARDLAHELGLVDY